MVCVGLVNVVIAVDFSRTIEDSDNVVPGKKLGPPVKGAKEALTELMNQGHQIIIHTALASTIIGAKAVADWLDYYEIPFTEIWAGPGKPVAGLYIDDKGYHFISWEQTLRDMIKTDESTWA